MLIRIPNYNKGYRIASLSKNMDSLSDLMGNDLDVIFLSPDGIILYPDGTKLTDDRSVMERFSYCDDYDVFEISEDGIAYLYYNNESDDNSFMVTGKCNSNCIMCPASEKQRRNGTASNVDDLINIVRHIPSDARHLTITGGEPFLLGKDLFRLLAAMRNKFMRTEFLILTNGRIFCRKDYCDLLIETMPYRTILGIPIHGYDPETHDAVTQAPGSFRQTDKGIRNLITAGALIELRIVVSKITAPYISRIAKHIIKYYNGISCVKIIGLEMLGNAAIYQEEVWIPYPEAFCSAKEGIEMLINAGIDVALYNFPLCAVEGSFWPIALKSISDYKVRYTDKCDFCAVKDACGGIFAGTIRLAKNDVVPIGGHEC